MGGDGAAAHGENAVPRVFDGQAAVRVPGRVGFEAEAILDRRAEPIGVEAEGDDAEAVVAAILNLAKNKFNIRY